MVVMRTALTPASVIPTAITQTKAAAEEKLITEAKSAAEVCQILTYRESTPLHEFRQCRMGSLIAGRWTTSPQILVLSSSLPTSPIATLPASLAGIGFTMTEALPTPLMPYGWPFCQHRHRHRRRDRIIAGTQKTPLPTLAPWMLYGRPFHHHLRHHCRRDNLIAGTRKTSSPTSAPSMLHSLPFRQHLHRHRRRDKFIASTRITSSPIGRSRRQHLHRQLLSTHQSMLRGQYHRWRQRLGPHRRHKPNHFVHGAFIKTLAKLATVLVGECVNSITLSLIAGTSAFSLITSYTGPFLRRLPSSQPSWWGNVLIPGSFPFDLSPVSSGPLAHYK